MIKDYVDGELIDIEMDVKEGLTEDNLAKIRWRTKEGRIIFIKDMEDSHLRNAALFLMGMGYTRCIAPEPLRIIYLSIFRMEWERRLAQRALGIKKWIVQ